MVEAHWKMTMTSFVLFEVLLALICCGHVLAQDCRSTAVADGPQLPTFPNQFSTEIEANILHFNLTTHVTEYYDNINDRGRIETYSQYGNNVTLVDYATMEVSHIMTVNGSKSCFAAPLNANSSRFARVLFGAQIINGSAHIKTPSEFLRFGEQFNVTYLGIEMVRGIPCHRWQRCNISEGSSNNYTLDYYFTQADWSPSLIPVQIVLNGTRADDNGTIHQVNNVYSFVNFRPGPADDDLFRVPPGQPCMGRITGKPLPPLPDDYYSALYEITYSEISTTFYFREYYSYSQQLYRGDFDQSFTNSTIIIEDFNEGVQYLINGRYGTCDITPINANGSIATEVGKDGMIHLESIKNHFLRQDQYNYTYEGLSNVRRVDTESWISLRDREVFNNSSVLTDGYVQVYYTSNWNISHGFNESSNSNMSVPWRVVIAGDFYSLSEGEANSSYFVVFEEVLEFKTTEPDFDVFDVSPCFSVDQYTVLRLTLTLPDNVTYSTLDHSLLRSRVRLALSQAVNISSSRLGGIEIMERSDKGLILNLNVLDQPPNSTHPNAITRDQIVEALMDKVNAGEINITLGDVIIIPSIQVPPSTTCSQPTMTITVTTTPTVIQCACDSKSDGLSSGATAGISLGMFAVGVVIGLISTIIICWVMRSVGKSSRYSTGGPYSKQKDDVVI